MTSNPPSQLLKRTPDHGYSTTTSELVPNDSEESEPVVVAPFLRRGAFQWFAVTPVEGRRLEQKQHGDQALLAVDNQKRGLAGFLVAPLFDVDLRADEVRVCVVVFTGMDHI